MNKLLIVAFVCVSNFVLTQSLSSNAENNEVNTFIEETIDQLGIPGVAVAIVQDNKIVYKNYLGRASLEYNVPVTDSSLFRLHSLSKVFVSVGIFQLIEQDRIALNDKISKYLTDLPDDWKNIEIKHLLSHSSGLPDMRDETNASEAIAKTNVYAMPIVFEPGERPAYNQTNFWLLNRIVRKLTSGSFQDFITTQFKKDSPVMFSNISDVVFNRVTEYKPNAFGELRHDHFIVQEYLYGAGGITMRLDDLIAWDIKLNNNRLISEAFKKIMLTSFPYKVGAAFSYAWYELSLNGISSYGFNGGGLVNYRIFPSKNISVIWFTNGYKIPHDLDGITNKLAGFFDEDLVDLAPEAGKKLHELFSSNTSENISSSYQNIKKEYPYVDFENVLNSLGYNFIMAKKYTKAIDVFKLNTEKFPTSSNTYDSLGEGYYLNNQMELSRINYSKSLELDPSNTNALEMIQKIKSGKN